MRRQLCNNNTMALGQAAETVSGLVERTEQVIIAEQIVINKAGFSRNTTRNQSMNNAVPMLVREIAR